MSNPFVPIQTANLDWHQDLPRSIQYNDIYYSGDGGIEQSRYVFIDGNNLIGRWLALPKDSIFYIAETGFGTGLNFLVAWALWEQYAPDNAQLHFISCEKHPLSLSDLKRCLAQWPQYNIKAELLCANYPILTPGYHQLSFCNGRVKLTLMLGDVLECYEQLLICGDPVLESDLRTSFIDAWFLDGFAPKKNPAMWSEPLVNIIALLSNSKTTLATYTAAQPIKTALSKYGFDVEKKKGHGPKRHMICASFSNPEPHRLKFRHTPWHVATPLKYQEKQAVVIGAGLAGCSIAYFLAIRGWQVNLIDENNTVGTGASANQHAVLFPKLSAYKSPMTQFMLSAFLYAHDFYNGIANQFNLGDLNGSLILAHNEKERLAQISLESWLMYYPELGLLVDSLQASDLSGIPIEQSGLFIPLSGWINSPELCRFLSNTPGITLITNERVGNLFLDKDTWLVNNHSSKVVILANGNKITDFTQTEHLSIKSIRGQMTSIAATERSALLKIPVCGEGHVLPSFNEVHSLGATYELGVKEPFITQFDDDININKLKHLAPSMNWSRKILDHWAGIRASTPDYLPLVGQVAKSTDFIKIFSGLESNSKRWIPHPGSYYPGLYAFAGFGSRGLTTIPLSAEWLASIINNELGCLPRNLVQALSPARFLRKEICRGMYK